MQMNTAIPFSGYQPNFVNALASGQQAAAQRNELSRMNALAQLYQAQGADILAGNQNALNALATVDPMAALGVADARQGMDARALQMDATRQDMRVQADAWAASLDDRERELRLRESQEFLGRLAAVDGNPQAFDALMVEMGKPELVGQYGMLPQMIDNLRVPADALAQYDARRAVRQEVKADSKAPEPFDPERYRVVGDALVDLNPGNGAPPAPVQFPGQTTTPAPDFDTVMDFRKEINSNPAVRNFIDISTAYNRIQSSAAVPSSAGDIALIFGFMKMLDPTSVVREGEFATAANSGGVDDTIRNLYNRVVSGERLQPEQRQQFMQQAEAIYGGQYEQFKRSMNDYAGIAQRYNIPLEDVMVDYRANQPTTEPPPPPPPPDVVAPPPSTVPPPGPQPTFAIPQPAQVSTWTDVELTNFLTQSTAQGVKLPPEVWDAIMARTMQLNEQALQ